MADRPKIMTMAVEEEGGEVSVVFRFGTGELSKRIPSGHSFSRASAILNDNGEMVDCELITTKV